MLVRTNPLFVYFASGAALLLSLLIRLSLDPWLGESAPLLTLFAAVGVAVWVGGYRPAIVVTLVGFVACDWLFIEPRGHISLSMTSSNARLAACLITSSVMIGLGESMRSAKRRALDAVRQLQVVAATMPAPVTRCSRDLKFVWVSRAYADWLDLPIQDVVGRPIRDVIGPKGFEELMPYFERALRGETVSYSALLHVHKIGPQWITTTYTPTYDQNGECDGWVESITDIERSPRA